MGRVYPNGYSKSVKEDSRGMLVQGDVAQICRQVEESKWLGAQCRAAIRFLSGLSVLFSYKLAPMHVRMGLRLRSFEAS